MYAWQWGHCYTHTDDTCDTNKQAETTIALPSVVSRHFQVSCSLQPSLPLLWQLRISVFLELITHASAEPDKTFLDGVQVLKEGCILAQAPGKYAS